MDRRESRTSGRVLRAPRQLLIVLLCLCLLPGATGFYQEIFQFKRRVTCLINEAKVLGYSTNLCEGENPGQFEGMVMYLEAAGVFSYEQLRLDTSYRDGVMADCAQHDFGGPNQTARPSNMFCSQEYLYSLAFMGTSICANKFGHHKLNSSWPKDPLTEKVFPVAMGCAKGCECCGANLEDCHNIIITTPSPPEPSEGHHGGGGGGGAAAGRGAAAAPAAAAPAAADGEDVVPSPNPPPGPSPPPGFPPLPPPPPNPPEPMGLLLYFHPYMGDGTYATSQFNLHKLVDTENLMLMAPQARTDDMGYGYWMGTDHFTGIFLNSASADGEDKARRIDPTTGMPGWQTNAVTPAQLNQLMTDNPDTSHFYDVLMQMLDPNTTAINRERIYVMGSGNGGDMAYRMACEYPGLFAGVILHDAVPFTNEAACRYEAPMHVLIHQQKKDDASQLGMVKYFAGMNGCLYVEPNKDEPPNRELQLLYNASDPMPKHYVFSADGPYPYLAGKIINDSVVYEVDTHYCVRDASVTMWISATVDDNSDAYDPDKYPALLRDWFRKTARPSAMIPPPPPYPPMGEGGGVDENREFMEPGMLSQEVNPMAASVELPRDSPSGRHLVVGTGVLLLAAALLAAVVRDMRSRGEYQALPQSPRSPRLLKDPQGVTGNYSHYGSFDPSGGEEGLLLEAVAIGPVSPESIRAPFKAPPWAHDANIMA